MEKKKAAYDVEYAKTNLRQIRLNINMKTEPELDEHLRKQDNVQGYIKSLIRADMKKPAAE